MSTPIFIVHFFDYGRNYLVPCLRVTSQNNPGKEIFLITSSPEIKELVDGLEIHNITVFLLDQNRHDELFAPVQEIFFHDQLNSEIFDLMCFRSLQRRG